GGYMVLSHRVNREERNQINRVLVDLSVLLARKDPADEVPKALHAIEVGRLAAGNTLQLPHDPQQGYVFEVHGLLPSTATEGPGPMADTLPCIWIQAAGAPPWPNW